MTVITALFLSSEPANFNGRGALPKREEAIADLVIELHRACCAVEVLGFEDAGACNFDSLEIQSRRNKRFETALTNLGFVWSYRKGPARYVVQPLFGGHAARRTYQCIAMRVAAIGHQVAANIDYVIDLAGRIQPAPELPAWGLRR
jgi:hypothetical protein